MTDRTCAVDGCVTRWYCRKMCKTHYDRFMRLGTTELPTRPKLACTECERPAHAQGLCTMHYQRRNTTVRPKYSGELCAIPDCDKPARFARSHGLCGMHASRLDKYGDPHYVTPNPQRNGVEPCSVEGCDKTSKALLMCAMHYSRSNRHGDVNALGRIEQCIVCSTPFEKRTGKQVCCSVVCRRARLLQYGRDYQTALRAANPKPPVPTFPAKCWFCSTEFAATKRRHRYCSKTCWQGARADSADYGSKRRKERLKQATVERFSKWDIFDRDNWACGICNEPIDPEETFPSGASVSLDHIIPIARGGDHVPSNCQAAHLSCNCRKHAKLIFKQ